MEKETRRRGNEVEITEIDINDLADKVMAGIDPEIKKYEAVQIKAFPNKKSGNGRYSVTFKVKVTADGDEINNDKSLEVAMLIGQSERRTCVMIINCYHNDLVFYNTSQNGLDKSIAYAASYISKSTARILGITLE
jgi:hypothetical protein